MTPQDHQFRQWHREAAVSLLTCGWEGEGALGALAPELVSAIKESTVHVSPSPGWVAGSSTATTSACPADAAAWMALHPDSLSSASGSALACVGYGTVNGMMGGGRGVLHLKSVQSFCPLGLCWGLHNYL